MKRPRPWDDPADVRKSDKPSPFDVKAGGSAPKRSAIQTPTRELSLEEWLLQRAEMYQLYMRQIPIPTERGSLIPCNSWTELGKSMKKLYHQPLHYLTNIQLKKWDQQRLGTKDEDQPIDAIIHPVKLEATVWILEEVNRLTASSHYIAQLWLQDSLYQAYIDSVVPEVYSGSR